jgi:hypothetical protein
MPHIDQVQIGSEFDLVEDVVLSVGSSLKSIITKYGGRLQLLNVPAAAPADAPRIIAITENFVLNFAPVRYDIFIVVPTQIRNEFNKVIDFTTNLFHRLGGDLAQLGLSYAWVGMIVNLEYPATEVGVPGIKLSEPVFDRLLSVKRGSRRLSAFQTQFGFEEGTLNKIFTISAYDSMKIKLHKANLQEKVLRVDRETADFVESGISVSLDVNNKPDKAKAGLLRDFQVIAQASRELYQDLPEILNLKGIIANE